MTQGGDDMDTTTTVTTKTGPGRSTALRSRRRAYDLIMASHYHYGGFGYRRIAWLFGLPKTTVLDAIRRIDRNDSELRATAVRWGHLRPGAGELGPIIYRDVSGGIDLGL